MRFPIRSYDKRDKKPRRTVFDVSADTERDRRGYFTRAFFPETYQRHLPKAGKVVSGKVALFAAGRHFHILFLEVFASRVQIAEAL